MLHIGICLYVLPIIPIIPILHHTKHYKYTSITGSTRTGIVSKKNTFQNNTKESITITTKAASEVAKTISVQQLQVQYPHQLFQLRSIQQQQQEEEQEQEQQQLSVEQNKNENLPIQQKKDEIDFIMKNVSKIKANHIPTTTYYYRYEYEYYKKV